MKAASLILALAEMATLALAARTATPVERDMAPRTYQSGSTTCYFACPGTVNGEKFNHKEDFTPYLSGDHLNECYYGETSDFKCDYEDDGTLNTSETTGVDCPTTAPMGGCGVTNPDPSQDFRKRSLRRRRTLAERRLAARQYKPKKASRK